jgi:hypothetical protein
VSESVPYIYSVTETRLGFAPLVDGLAAGTHGPVILGPRARPVVTLLAFSLFDEMRDELSILDVLRAVPELAQRVTHPSGTAVTTVGVLTGSTSTETVTFWPDVVGDLRAGGATAGVADTLDAILTGDLDGEDLVDERLTGEWAWFLVTNATGTKLATGHYVIWRRVADELELVGVLPTSAMVARAWQPSPDPQAVDPDAAPPVGE